MLLTIANNALAEADQQVRELSKASSFSIKMLFGLPDDHAMVKAFGGIVAKLAADEKLARRMRADIYKWQQTVVSNFESR
jgi:hypothetical protein